MSIKHGSLLVWVSLIPVFNILKKNNLWVTLSHPKHTKPQKGNKTDHKDAKWICDLYMCGMVKPSNILSDLKPYTLEDFLEPRPVNELKALTTSQALNLLKLRGFTITDDVVNVS